MEWVYLIALNLLAMVTVSFSKPISVTFGTRQGPIIPPPISTTTVLPHYRRQDPAPVSEIIDDIPNTSAYKPLVPQQYRNSLLSFAPNPNLILGTAQDQKYLTSSSKFYELKRAQARAYGLDYSGPQFFSLQDYEVERLRHAYKIDMLNKLNARNYPSDVQAPSQYNLPHPNQAVPQIGIIYSSGVRYYVPQYDHGRDQPIHENSVYDASDKYYYFNRPQQNVN